VLDTLISISRCTPSLMVGIDADMCHWKPKRRARRARIPDGSRKAKRSRRQVANSSVGQTGLQDEVLCPVIGAVQVNNQWWADRGMFALETANGNFWASLHTSVLLRSRADIIFGQETKLHSDSAIASAENASRKAGWNPTLAKAHRVAVHFGSGGGAILARRGTGITPTSDGLIPKEAQFRLNLAWVDAILKGGIHCLKR
jgi:hypothetical protein